MSPERARARPGQRGGLEVITDRLDCEKHTAATAVERGLERAADLIVGTCVRFWRPQWLQFAAERGDRLVPVLDRVWPGFGRLVAAVAEMQDDSSCDIVAASDDRQRLAELSEWTIRDIEELDGYRDPLDLVPVLVFLFDELEKRVRFRALRPVAERILARLTAGEPPDADDVGQLARVAA